MYTQKTPAEDKKGIKKRIEDRVNKFCKLIFFKYPRKK